MARAKEASCRAPAQQLQAGPQHSHRCPSPLRDAALTSHLRQALREPQLAPQPSKAAQISPLTLAHLSLTMHMWLCLHTSLQAQPLPAGSLGGLHSHHPPIDLGVPQEWSDVSPTVILRHDEQRATLLLLEAPSPFSFTPHAFLFLHSTHICKLYCFVLVFFKRATLFAFLKKMLL